jgi:hypothetical protein
VRGHDNAAGAGESDDRGHGEGTEREELCEHLEGPRSR